MSMKVNGGTQELCYPITAEGAVGGFPIDFDTDIFAVATRALPDDAAAAAGFAVATRTLPDDVAVVPGFTVPTRAVLDAAAASCFAAPVLFDAVAELENKLEANPAEVERKLQKERDKAREQGERCIDSKPIISRAIELFQCLSTRKEFIRNTGLASLKGQRLTMEDEDIAEEFTFSAGGERHIVSISGIFDGHLGSEMALFAKENIIINLRRRLEEYNREGLSNLGIRNAIKKGFVDLDQSFRGKSGSTANVALKIDGDLWIANLGDSRALLVGRDGNVTQLSEDAKPSDPRYAKGIRKRGGEVLFDRVEGDLDVARSLGDHCYRGVISARPKITRFLASEIEGFTLVQGCDGVFDVLSNIDVGRLVVSKMRTRSPLKDVAATVVQAAYEHGSEDNISVLVKPL